MRKQTICFTSACHLSLHNNQLAIAHKQTGECTEQCIEDIALILLEHRDITLTQSLISELALHKVAVLFCDSKHYPCSLLWHMDGHSTQTLRFAQQIAISTPLKKNLWKQIVLAKIRNQQKLLHNYNKQTTLPTNVLSGDRTNVEAQAARLYWPALLGKTFRRDRYGAPPNPALNYGYTILRSAVARALCMAGLLPMLGLQHKNKYNNFCLADDVMEPYRPFVDSTVKKMLEKGMACDLEDKEEKKELLSILNKELCIKKEKSVLIIALQHTAYALTECFAKKRKNLFYPMLQH